MAEWKTRWKCNKCGCSDTVVHDESTGCSEVLDLIEGSHEVKSPNCTEFSHNSMVIAMVSADG